MQCCREIGLARLGRARDPRLGRGRDPHVDAEPVVVRAQAPERQREVRVRWDAEVDTLRYTFVASQDPVWTVALGEATATATFDGSSTLTGESAFDAALTDRERSLTFRYAVLDGDRTYEIELAG